MAYDKDKDKLISETVILNGVFRVATFSYNGGVEKVTVQERGSYRDKESGEDVETWMNIKGRKTKEDYYIIGKTLMETCNTK